MAVNTHCYPPATAATMHLPAADEASMAFHRSPHPLLRHLRPQPQHQRRVERIPVARPMQRDQRDAAVDLGCEEFVAPGSLRKECGKACRILVPRAARIARVKRT